MSIANKISSISPTSGTVGTTVMTITPYYNDTRYQYTGTLSFEASTQSSSYTTDVQVVLAAKPYLEEEPPYSEVSASGGTRYYVLYCPNYSWWFRSIYDWITITDTGGTVLTEGVTYPPTSDGGYTLNFSIAANTDTSVRTDSWSIGYTKYNGDTANTQTCVIVQSAADAPSTSALTLSKTVLDSPGDVFESYVTGNTDWQFEYSSWLTPDRVAGTSGYYTTTWTAETNYDLVDRTGYIQITSSAGSISVSVTQTGISNYVIYYQTSNQDGAYPAILTGWPSNFVDTYYTGSYGEMEFDDDVTLFPSYGFYASGSTGYCERMTEIHVPPSVTVLNENAFQGCDELAAIYFHRETAPTVYSTTFSGVASSGVIYYPSDSVTSYSTVIENIPSGWTAEGY